MNRRDCIAGLGALAAASVSPGAYSATAVARPDDVGNFRYIYSFDDQSSQLSSLIEWNFDTFELYSVLQANFGDRSSSLKRLIDYQLMIGAIYKL